MSQKGNKKKAAVRRTRGASSSAAPLVAGLSLGAAVLVVASAAGTYFLLHRNAAPGEETAAVSSTAEHPTEAESATEPLSNENLLPPEPETEPETLPAQSEATDPYTEEVEYMIRHMSLEEKINQLFIVSPEALVRAEDPEWSSVTQVGSLTETAFRENPVGGILLSPSNRDYGQQDVEAGGSVGDLPYIRQMTADFQAINEAYEYSGEAAAPSAGTSQADTVSSETGQSETGLSESAATGAPAAGRTAGTSSSETGQSDIDVRSGESFTIPLLTCVTETSLREFLYLGQNGEAVEVEDVTLKSNGVNMLISDYESTLTLRDTNSLVDVLNAEGGFMQNYGTEHVSDGAMASTQLQYLQNPAVYPCVVLDEQIYAAADPSLIREGIRSAHEEGGAAYDGVVICPIDSGEVETVMAETALGSNASGDADYMAQAAGSAFLAGADMILCTSDFTALRDGLLSAYENGVITDEIIEEALVHVLTMKLKYFGPDPRNTIPAETETGEGQTGILLQNQSQAQSEYTDPPAQPVSGSQTQAASDDQPQSVSGSQTQVQPVSGSQTQTQPASGSQTQAASDSRPQSASDAQTQSRPESANSPSGPGETLPTGGDTVLTLNTEGGNQTASETAEE